LALYLAEIGGGRVTGITLSQEQYARARQRAIERGRANDAIFRLEDYRDVEGPFDRIVSVGMFEHVGVGHYDTYFRKCASVLDQNGVFLLHTIGRSGAPSITNAWIAKYIFPGGYIPALSETVEASEKMRLIATDVEMLRLHYAQTLREWYRRCLEHRDAIIALFDERFFRLWTFYLSGSTAAFESGGLCNYQIQYARNRHALPLARGYIEDEERRLLGSGQAVAAERAIA
jgi:cyclopropane-fatty-acyl-phospholipid synthase